MKILSIIAIIVIFSGCLSSGVLAGNENALVKGGLENTAKSAQMQSDNPNLVKTVGMALGVLLSILSLFFLILGLYGGITWMFSGGSEDQIKKSKSILINGALGMAVCLSAWALSKYVTDKVAQIFGA